ncbi:MAG TPA: SPOR domain-containing protein [Rhodanobacteraceae bacterium]|nr:SPOR domain-containing protein [Rhodanobacteraceae bacterium]
MDLSLKQRLLGAIVLIALAVIFVPMLLSGPAPQATSETVNLAIPPAPDREFQNRVLPVDTATPATTSATKPADAPAVVTTEPVATVETPRRPAEIPQPTVATATPPATPVAAEPAPTKPAAPAKAEPESKAAPEPGRAADGSFYVQLGVYAETKNADDLVAALKQGGFSAFAEASEYQGKSVRRVRVGPYEDRAAAEAARLRIKQIKPAVPGSVVATAEDAKADAPASALPAGRAGGWAVQLGAFKTVDEASKMRDRLKNAGFVAFVDKADTGSGTLWRVRAGPEADRGNADKLKGRIKDKLKIEGMVVTQQ